MHKSEIIVDCDYPGINPKVFGYEKCSPGHFYGPAVRTYWLLHYVIKGSGIFERDNKKYIVKAGDIFVIPPYLETYYQADKTAPWEYIWIGFTSDIPLPDCFSQAVIHAAEAGEIFEKMRLCSSMDSGKSAYLAGCLWQLISVFLEKGRQKTDCIDKALSFIHSQYSTDITVSELALKLNLDRCHFSTMFKNRVGTSPADYIRCYRLTKAAELMRGHFEKPATAAYSVGYSDLSHFSKNFKSQFGVSPRKYIEICKNES